MAAKQNKTSKKLKKQIEKLNERIDNMIVEMDVLREAVSTMRSEGLTRTLKPEDKDSKAATDQGAADIIVTEQMVEQTADMIDSAEEADELLENIESEAKEVCVLSGDNIEQAEEAAEAAEEAAELLEESARIAGQDTRLSEEAVERAEELAEDAEEVAEILEKKDQ